ncbi:unnamed protein product [Ilex paraguariensis]|uniref:Uncharacterized protein n=1 Tax=Ilex paraguariensis TaxID=185542 RepID=A0ABC8STH0_9AQUA
METMKHHIFSKTTINPSSPTPNHLNSYNLSSLDQLSPHIYTPLVLFYPRTGSHSQSNVPDDISSRLKNSLSKTLTQYYPFAESLSETSSMINCNDEGVNFFEARMDCKLSDILKQSEPKTLDLLCPSGILWNDSYEGSLVVIQVTVFSCGGIVVGVCMLHRIGDGCTKNAFIKDCAAIAVQSQDHQVSHVFISSSILQLNDPPVLSDKLEQGNCITRRLVFSALKLANLKTMVKNLELNNASQVEGVSALIYNCAMAASRAISSASSPFILILPVNLRPRIVPPLPENSLSPHIYTPLVLFYPRTGSHSQSNVPDDISSRLKNSLSKTLTQYYPFAESLSETSSMINCNDEGVNFFEARMDCKLSDILKQSEPKTLDLLCPSGILWNDSYEGSLVVIQVTVFSCGGIVVGVCMLHRIGDGCTKNAFIKDCAAIAVQSQDHQVSHVFISSSILQLNDPPVLSDKLEQGNCITRRLVFSALKLANLKTMVKNLELNNASQVEGVSALIYNCAMAASRAISSASSPFILILPVNLRPRIVPPLPENSVENFSWFFLIMVRDESDQKLEKLVSTLRKGIAQLFDKYTKNRTTNECYSLICESIKEARKTLSNRSGVHDTFLLIDALEEGGIKTLVTLEEKEMAIFERGEELLAFASLNLRALENECVPIYV